MKPHFVLLCILLLLVCGSGAYAQQGRVYDREQPCALLQRLQAADEGYNYALPTGNAALRKRFEPLLQAYQLPFTDHIWSMILEQALEARDTTLSRQLSLEADEGMVFFSMPRAYEPVFLTVLCGLLSHPRELEAVLRRFDRSGGE
jgi:hypothetical protein